MKRLLLTCAMGLSILCCLAAGALAAESASGEVKVALKMLPPAVQQSVHEVSKGAVVRGVSRETDNDSTVYEVEMRIHGRVQDVTLAPDGRLLVVEEEVPLDSLPAPVRTTVAQHVGKGSRLLLVETVTKEGTFAYYEAHVRTGKKKVETEIRIGADGAVLPADGK